MPSEKDRCVYCVMDHTESCKQCSPETHFRVLAVLTTPTTTIATLLHDDVHGRDSGVYCVTRHEALVLAAIAFDRYNARWTTGRLRMVALPYSVFVPKPVECQLDPVIQRIHNGDMFMQNVECAIASGKAFVAPRERAS